MNRIVNVTWAGSTVSPSVPRPGCGMFEYFIQAHKALFGPVFVPPTTKEMGKGFRRVCRGVESLGFELFALWF